MNWHLSITRQGAAALWWLSLAVLLGVLGYGAGYETRRAMERAAWDQRVLDAAERVVTEVQRDRYGELPDSEDATAGAGSSHRPGGAAEDGT